MQTKDVKIDEIALIKRRIGICLPDSKDKYWADVSQLFVKRLNEAGHQVYLYNANSPDEQDAQFKELRMSGTRAIIIFPLVDYLNWDLHENNDVKVIAFGRVLQHPKLAAYVRHSESVDDQGRFAVEDPGRIAVEGLLKIKGSGNFVILTGEPNDPYAAAFLRGVKEVLQPSINSGAVKIVEEVLATNWDRAGAKKSMERILGSASEKIDAVIAISDLTTRGAIDALKEKGQVGKIAVASGEISEATCNAIASGDISVGVFSDVRELIPIVCETAIKFDTLQEVPELMQVSLGELLNNSSQMEIPCLLKRCSLITKENLKQLIVDAGIYSYEAVYKDIQGAPAK